MRRKRKSQHADAEVPLSPLIDCVFLLLIFFLVTSMIKRWERQIPTRLEPDATALVTGEQNEEIELGVDTAGRVYEIQGRSKIGLQATIAGDPGPYIASLASQVGHRTPITLIVEENTEFQLVIRVMDELEIQGFERVRARASDVDLDGQGGFRKPD